MWILTLLDLHSSEGILAPDRKREDVVKTQGEDGEDDHWQAEEGDFPRHEPCRHLIPNASFRVTRRRTNLLIKPAS